MKSLQSLGIATLLLVLILLPALGADPPPPLPENTMVPSACIFSDQLGINDNDQNENCLYEVTIQNNGQSADIDDSEEVGGYGVMELNFTDNQANISSVDDAVFKARYKRETEDEAGMTLALINVWNNENWVLACWHLIESGSFEEYVCDISQYVQTEEELNNIKLNLIVDTISDEEDNESDDGDDD